MLIAQIPYGAQEKIAAEVGFNFGVISGKVGAEGRTLESRVARLKVVEEFVRSSEAIGTPSVPAKWIEGELSMAAMDVGRECLLYVGEGQNWILGLAGSARHLASGAAPTSVSVPFSFLPSIASHLAALSVSKPGLLDAVPERMSDIILAPGVKDGVKRWFEVISWCSGEHERSDQYPLQRVRFIAKRLAVQQTPICNVVLASPLFIEALD